MVYSDVFYPPEGLSNEYVCPLICQKGARNDTFRIGSFRLLHFGSRHRRAAGIGPLLEILDCHCLGRTIRVHLPLDGGDLDI